MMGSAEPLTAININIIIIYRISRFIIPYLFTYVKLYVDNDYTLIMIKVVDIVLYGK